MTQANDLGQIGNQLAANYRTRVNVNIQSIVTQHYGAAEPAPVLPNMLWFSSGDGYIKVRNPTNTGWQTIGTIGPPMKWTNIDTPATGWKTGDVKVSVQGAEAGWIRLDDGTIGDHYSGATNRAHPDTAALFSWLWLAGGLPLYVAGTSTQVERGASAAADFAAHRHISLPRVCGRAMTTAGQGKHMDVNVGTPNTNSLSFGWWTGYNGEEQVQLNWNHMPEHAHWVPGHNHNLARALPNYVANKSTSSGPYTIADTSSGVTWTETWPGANSGNAGANLAHNNLGPRFYIFLLIKL